MVSHPRQAAPPSVDDRVANQFSTLLYFLHKKKQMKMMIIVMIIMMMTMINDYATDNE